MSVPAPGEIAELRDTMTNDEIFTVLVEECGARESLRAEFLHHWPCEMILRANASLRPASTPKRPSKPRK